MRVPLRKKDSVRALEILNNLKGRITTDEYKSFRNAVDKLIMALESPLFSSLIDVQEYYETLLGCGLEHTTSCGHSSKSSNLTHSESPRDGSVVSPKQTSTLTPRSPNNQTITQPEWEYLEVVLKKDVASPGGFGFSIAGGVDFSVAEGDSGIYVTRITPNGCADVDGRLRVDDQILAVNGISLEHVTNMEAVQTMKRAGSSMQLIVRRYLGNATATSPAGQGTPAARSPDALSDFGDSGQMPIWIEVQLRKPSPNVSLGLSIAGGQDVEDDQLPAPGIFVTRITPGGLAYKDGRIMPGDQLMQVNGIDVSQMSHADAVQVLRSTGQVLNLVLTRYPQSMDS
ncbi:hypothetical protein AHF37_02193 [Paragonimus kellicotti]|nr:hypothetical protein AHF37_02193 [Paragonimus kellicotti]